MLHDPPKFSLTIELNKSPPSILVCSIHNGPTLVTAKYYTNFNNYHINKAELSDDLVGDFSDLIGSNGKCRFFNGTSSSSSKLRGNAGGFYVLGFGQDENASGISPGSSIVGDSDRGAFVFIGDTNNEMDWTQPIFLRETNLLSSVGTFGFIDYSRPAAAYDVGIIAPENIVAQQDRKKLFEELEKINGERSTKLNISKEEEKGSDSVTKTSKISNQTEFKNLLAKYYVETDFYEHSVETPDV
ncbi:hypothetical protein RhiirA1_541220 [Rhizophagus irregularis]|uniref:Uncharacterized protein n=1 Tax=Rhizophagus irregularis TaxID=588596 RepID=A0A2N0R4G4_9GLOM|nr:hypothetical protein RhiirA1_541220 [Rhizophagus irregularis]